jgi:glycerol-3-phosphate O-acyltransferase / dihydroxyacetone phosphate acyltransferase
MQAARAARLTSHVSFHRLDRMWLHSAFVRFSRAAVETFYDTTYAGRRVPRRGPVLLVANHPNSLVDPGFVISTARRPVHFLAKSPLFGKKTIGWLVRASGAIPVYRRDDDPRQLGRNEDMFRAVFDALAAGKAVGIFPEGWSHSEPRLTPLKTGAARIALGAAAQIGRPFPILPVGLTFRFKNRFRSPALSLVGEEIRWDDLAGRGPGDAAAVRQLTERIERALLEVTINLEQWEDGPLLELAEAVYQAEFGGDVHPAERFARMRIATGILGRLRREDPERADRLAQGLRQHRRMLEVLQLSPDRLGRLPSWTGALRWGLRRFVYFGLGAPVAALGFLVFFIPYRVTGWATRRANPLPDVQATYKLLGGAFLFLVWIAALAMLAGWLWGRWASVIMAVALPIVALVTQAVRERWGESVRDVRRYLLLRGREDVRMRIKRRQRALALQLRRIMRDLNRDGAADRRG